MGKVTNKTIVFLDKISQATWTMIREVWQKNQMKVPAGCCYKAAFNSVSPHVHAHLQPSVLRGLDLTSILELLDFLFILAC